MMKLFSDNPLENLDFFMHYLRSTVVSLELNLSAENYSSLSSLSARQICYTGDKLKSVIICDDDEVVSKLLKFWSEQLLSNKIVKAVFDENKWHLPDKYLTTELHVEWLANSLESKYLQRDRTTNNNGNLEQCM